MTEVKPTIVSQIRAFKAANPDASVAQVAAACNTSKPYVHQVLFPKGKKKVEAPKVDTPKVEATSSKDQDKLIATLRKELADYQENEMKFEKAYNNMLLDLVKAKSVIEYLEEKLDAAPV
jgi:cytochrome c1